MWRDGRGERGSLESLFEQTAPPLRRSAPLRMRRTGGRIEGRDLALALDDGDGRLDGEEGHRVDPGPAIVQVAPEVVAAGRRPPHLLHRNVARLHLLPPQQRPLGRPPRCLRVGARACTRARADLCSLCRSVVRAPAPAGVSTPCPHHLAPARLDSCNRGARATQIPRT